ncbi:LacI family DNA-binding transcriptional regulator [Labedella endophytica]|uniref:LacI family DNA-binding transcriptional regulator n=1 Tax=Labedella endophytica TaxID=1523160 RepID=UPI001FB6989A|nr:LacI family DNA-binding transcriptional regulator [Labedella endophytica]
MLQERSQGVDVTDEDRGAEQRERAVTLREVAAAAGVSVSTASRLLDKRYEGSSPANARRVREAADRLGYTRDYAASSLRRQGTSTIGVLVPRLSDAVMGILYEEIARECGRRDVQALVATTQDDPEQGRKAAASLLSRKVDGLIMTTARTDDGFAEELRAAGVPHVLALRTAGESPSVVTDDHLGGYLAVRHLADLGHRRIGIIAGPRYASSALARLDGALDGLRESGCDLGGDLVRGDGFSVEAGEDAAGDLLDAGAAPTAIFAVTDHAAIGAMAAAARRGLTVPGDLSVVGFNDIPLARHLPTPLSSVRASLDLIAQAAVRMLVEGQSQHLVFPPTMIPRASSGPLAV